MMSDATLNELRRLLVIHYRSLPVYLSYARPWSDRGQEQAVQTLQHIAGDQQQMVERLSKLILDTDAALEWGEFPIEFTDLHDLSITYLLSRLVEWQRGDIESIRQCLAALNDDADAETIAQEALGMAKGHLESLEELIQT